MEDPEYDMNLITLLGKFKNRPDDIELWSLVPELYAICFASKRWQQALYRIQLEGHVNGVSSTALAIQTLIFVFSRIQTKFEQDLNSDASIQDAVERFVRCSAYSLLHLQSHHDLAPNGIKQMMVFLEQFIVTVGRKRLSLAYLEQCFPFTLMRSNYIRIYETQADHAMTELEEDERVG